MPNKTALITGSSRGLGESIALEFANNGYDVILHGRDEERLNKVGRAVLECGSTYDIVIGDITSEETIDKLIDAATRRDLGVLINNAGVYSNRTFQLMSDEDIRRIIKVNLIAPMILIKSLLPIFVKKREGLIVNINSIAGKQAGNGEAVYCASKHGLRGFSSSLQYDAVDHNVRIIDIYPGAMKTDMIAEREDGKKFIQPSDAAHLIYRLAEDYHSMRIKEVDIGRRNY